MDFFERYLGFSGGRGDGSLEAIFLVVLFTIILVISARLLSIGKAKDNVRSKHADDFCCAIWLAGDHSKRTARRKLRKLITLRLSRAALLV